MLNLTSNNYYTLEANQAYWSASFVKSMLDCPARSIAELNGQYTRPATQSILIGAYVDAYFEGSLETFKETHPELFKRDGALKAEYVKADAMIRRAERDPIFMEYMQGSKQVILTGSIEGIPFRSKLDVFWPGKRIVDLKTAKDMEPMYRAGQGRLSFAEYWNWPLQMAIYQAVEGHNLPCYLAVITKEEPPDIAVIEIPQHTLDAEMEVLKEKLPYFDAIRCGVIEPPRCEKCDYCRATKRIVGAISLDDLVEFEGGAI